MLGYVATGREAIGIEQGVTPQERSFVPELYEHCGILGFIAWNGSNTDPSEVQSRFLGAANKLKHRGQQHAGIIGINELGALTVHNGKGSVKDNFPPDTDKELDIEKSGIFHGAWTTDLSPNANEGGHPVIVPGNNRMLVLAHNGQFLKPLNEDGEHPHDSAALGYELMRHWNSQQESDPFAVLTSVLPRHPGSYSLIMKFIEAGKKDGHLYVARDPREIRPLVFGSSEAGLVVASETGALDAFGAELIDEIYGGNVYRFDRSGGIVTKKFTRNNRLSIYLGQTIGESDRRSCIFENVYLSRKEHRVPGMPSVGEQRYQAGRMLVELLTNDELKDMTTRPDDYLMACMPATAVPAVEALCEAVDMVHTKPIDLKDSTRSYINGSALDAQTVLGGKFYFDQKPETWKDKKVYIVDDSLVRGETAKEVIRKMEALDVKEVHFLITSPKIENSCDLGANIRSEELIAPGKTDQEIAESFGANIPISVRYLSLDKLKESTGQNPTEFCTGCMDGNYATNHPVQYETGQKMTWRVPLQDIKIPGQLHTAEMDRIPVLA